MSYSDISTWHLAQDSYTLTSLCDFCDYSLYLLTPHPVTQEALITGRGGSE